MQLSTTGGSTEHNAAKGQHSMPWETKKQALSCIYIKTSPTVRRNKSCFCYFTRRLTSTVFRLVGRGEVHLQHSVWPSNGCFFSFNARRYVTVTHWFMVNPTNVISHWDTLWLLVCYLKLIFVQLIRREQLCLGEKNDVKPICAV